MVSQIYTFRDLGFLSFEAACLRVLRGLGGLGLYGIRVLEF